MVIQKNVKLAILCTHPIQYYAPWFRFLAKGQKPEDGIWDMGYRGHQIRKFEFEVFYAHKQTGKGQAEAGFGVEFEWDIPLLEGYPYRFLENVSSRQGLDWFGGCDCPEVGKILKEGKFTHLLCIGWHKKVFWQAIWAAKRLGIRTLSRGDSQLGMQGFGPKMLIKELTHRVLVRAFGALLYVGRRNFEYLRHYGVPDKRLFFSPHFVDNEWWAANAGRSRKGYGISDMGYRNPSISNIQDPRSKKRDTVFLFAGKFIPKKRVSDLLEAAARVPEARVVLVGDGPLKERLEARANQPDLKGRVEFAGFKNQKELPAYLAEADCLVLPSDGTETWGLIVNEAMACGLPAIVSDACGCSPDLIEEGKTGYSYSLGDVDALVDRMLLFLGKKNQDWSVDTRAKVNAYRMAKASEGLMIAMGKTFRDVKSEEPRSR